MYLRGTKIIGQVDMRGAIFDGTLHADTLQVKGDLIMKSEGHNKATFKNVVLNGAKIAGQVDMHGATFSGVNLRDALAGASVGVLLADRLEVGSSLYMRSEGQNKASFGEVYLPGAKITGQVCMIGASFTGTLRADALQVGNSLYMNSDDQNLASFKDVNGIGHTWPLFLVLLWVLVFSAVGAICLWYSADPGTPRTRNSGRLTENFGFLAPVARDCCL